MGPTSALRQRRVQGYAFPAVWRKITWGTSIFSSLCYLFCMLYRKAVSSTQSVDFFKSRCPPFKKMEYNGTNIFHYYPKQAEKSPFFHSFWKSVQKVYPVTPSRNFEDLKWRYWDNPYISYHTLVLDSITAGSAIAILHSPLPGKMIIDDFIVEYPQSRSFGILLKAVIQWASRHKVNWLEFTTTDDSINWIGWNNFDPGFNHQIIQKIMDVSKHSNAPKMPRKITANGHKIGIKLKNWYVTPMVFEGI